MVGKCKVELSEKHRTASSRQIRTFSGADIFKVFMVSPNKKRNPDSRWCSSVKHLF